VALNSGQARPRRASCDLLCGCGSGACRSQRELKHAPSARPAVASVRVSRGRQKSMIGRAPAVAAVAAVPAEADGQVPDLWAGRAPRVAVV
jgi:hypothetical protein